MIVLDTTTNRVPFKTPSYLEVVFCVLAQEFALLRLPGPLYFPPARRQICFKVPEPIQPVPL